MKLQLAEFPAKSLAVHFTVVSPTGNSNVPICGVQASEPTPTLSVTFGAAHITDEELVFGVVRASLLLVQTITGGVTSIEENRAATESIGAHSITATDTAHVPHGTTIQG